MPWPWAQTSLMPFPFRESGQRGMRRSGNANDRSLAQGSVSSIHREDEFNAGVETLLLELAELAAMAGK
ncbi:MAG: hypothetical protein V7604_592 [Hyphomicrobiales bacterium]